MGSTLLDIGLSEEDAVGRDRFSLFQASAISDAHEVGYTTTLALNFENVHTKRCKQTGKPWRERKSQPEQSIPPLDALIIPKAARECKAKSHLSAHPPPMCFCLSHCITAMQGGAPTYYANYVKMKGMNLQNSSEVIATLRQRLEPVERADALSDILEGQRPQARKAAVLLGLFDQDGEMQLVFIRRASTLRAHSGEIAFPGGAVDVGDSSPLNTALREAREEIGLDPARVDVLGVLPPVFTVVSNFLIIPVVAFLPQGLGTLHLQASEVTELILAPLRGLANPAILHTEEWTRGGLTRTVHFYEYGHYTIWGATARILNALLGVLGV